MHRILWQANGKDYGPAGKFNCTTGKTATFKFVPKIKPVRAEECSIGTCDRVWLNKAIQPCFVDCILGTDGEIISQWDAAWKAMCLSVCVCVCYLESQCFRMPARSFSAGPHSQNATAASEVCACQTACLYRSARHQRSTRQSPQCPAWTCPFQ